jgi:hypothetical protein
VSSYRVTPPVSRACEQSAAQRCTVEPHCSGLAARFAGYDDTACPHVLQAPNVSWKHVSLAACLG